MITRYFISMKNFICFIFFLNIFFSFAQQNDKIVLNWKEEPVYFSEGNKISIPNFVGEEFIYQESNRSISFAKKIPVSSTINEGSLIISNIEYETISLEKLGYLDTQIIPININATIENSLARDVNYGVFSFSPIVKEGTVYKKVISLTYTFDYGISNKTILSTNAAQLLSNSVLKSGIWKKFYVEKSGVYKLSKAFLVSLGFNANVDPRTIQIFGNGGRMVPLLNATPYPEDLIENAIYFEGENDGVFNDVDFILFYAEGVDNWNSENQTHLNLFSDKSIYYVTSSTTTGKRMTPIAQSTATASNIYSVYDDYQFHELDKINVARLGRKWFGEQFNIQSTQTFPFSIPNIVTTAPLNIKITTAGVGVVSTLLKVQYNNTDQGNIVFAPVVPSGVLASEITFSRTINSPAPNSIISLEYNNNGVPNSNAYLDYITLTSKAFLRGFGKQFRFTVNEIASQVGTCEYQISSANTISQVWDITDIYNIKNLGNNGQASISFKTLMGTQAKYIAVDNLDFYSPLKESNTTVFNQDIKGTIFKNNQGVFQDIDYIIVTPNSLLPAAEKLASFHRTYSALNVKVITLEAIYPEFSSGKQDIGGIRNLVKYVYNNASVPSKKLKYLCLFGDASFDYKNRIPNNTNLVPVFHALYSFSLSASFMSDDYYGLMDSNEGTMNGFQGLDVAVGRIVASNLQQAQLLVAKTFDYHEKLSYGRWRNNLVLISDDIDINSDNTIQTDLDDLANTVIAQKPFFNVKKLHADSFLQETTSGGQKYPKLKSEILSSFEQGALIFDYFGHGGEDGLARERIFEIPDAIALVNKYKYPLFITVTCEFTRFDNPYRPTAGEFLYQNISGGAVGMITTTRQIGQSTGADFNRRIMQNLLSYGSNSYPTIAEGLRLAKVSSASSGNNVVFYIGDPALKLAIPIPKVVLTKVNDMPITGPTDTLQALAFVKLAGEVTDESGNLLSGYNGDVAVQVFDKDVQRSTLGNDNYRVAGVLQIMNFTTLGETIFRGNASVKNGKFDFGFTVPRDIKIPVGNGKISFYAKTNTPLQDQSGHDFSIKIGGLNVNAVADNLPPKLRLYMNDESFVNGGITNQSPLFLAFLEDEHGINTASGIGHDIIAYLDGDESKPYVLNDFYETELDNYTKGKLKYPFRNLALGLHTLTFKAWDVYNNIVSADLQFLVVGDETLTLTNVLNYPNPFVNHTEFWFTHNKPSEPLEVQIQVFTITGKVVWTKNQIVNTTGFLSRDITWDGRDDFGDKIGKGVYVYKLTVRSTISNKRSEKFEKLVIL